MRMLVGQIAAWIEIVSTKPTFLGSIKEGLHTRRHDIMIGRVIRLLICSIIRVV